MENFQPLLPPPLLNMKALDKYEVIPLLRLKEEYKISLCLPYTPSLQTQSLILCSP